MLHHFRCWELSNPSNPRYHGTCGHVTDNGTQTPGHFHQTSWAPCSPSHPRDEWHARLCPSAGHLATANFISATTMYPVQQTDQLCIISWRDFNNSSCTFDGWCDKSFIFI